MLDGAARLDELVAKAVADGQPALGITDHGNMYGTLEFYKECRKQGIKPVIGTEAYMAHDHRSERPARRGRVDDSGGDTEGGKKLYYHLTLLAESDAGYRNLIQLSSKAFLEGYYYKPRLDWDLLAQHHEGLIATTGCLGGHVLQSLLQGDEKGALEKAGRLQEIFGRDNLFVELQDHGLPAQRDTNPQAGRAGHQAAGPAAGHERLALHPPRGPRGPRRPAVRADRGRAVGPQALQVRGQRALPEDVRRDALPLPGGARGVRQHAVDRRAGRAWRSSSAPPSCPTSRCPRASTDDTQYLAHVTWEGVRERWGDDVPETTKARIQFELDVIATMGFSSYFLIVWDLISYARYAGHPRRPRPWLGRRAAPSPTACGSPTSTRSATTCIFERFLNPSRISMPDIDMDFDSRYRDEMIRYAAERYGRDHVAQIITFGTIKARNAVRDAARVLGFPYNVGDRIAKAMPPLVMGRDTPLKYCFEQHPKYADGYKAASELRAMYDTDPDVKKVVDVAKGLEGLKRSDGIHAAAVVITKEPLTEYLPVQRKPESGQDPALAPVVTQYEMHGVEELGLLKMDFLGLRNLDVITDTVAMLDADRAPDFDIDAIPLDDPLTLEMLQRGLGHRRVPAGGCADAGAHAVAEADQLRRRRRPRRAVPAGADGGQHAQRLRRPQERAQADRVPPPRPRGGPRRHVRPDDLPGVGHAGGPEDRRLLAGRGRPAAQGDGQEVPRGHRHRAGQVRRRPPRARATARCSASSCSTSSSRSPTTRSTRATPSATASSPTRRPTSRRTTRSSTSPAC